MTEETDVYICGICKKEFKDFVTFLQHKSSFGVFKCKLCNLSYHDREDIQKHINSTHSNQKVDVAFTIPTKASIVSTQSDTTSTPEPSEPSKSGYAISVYTCRLCNRFTLVEKSMLHHLQVVHKIHVVPGSVELAALMLCSKPLDVTSIPKLTGNPVVVKTVSTPSISKSPTVYLTAATQTRLSSLNISELANHEENEDSTDKLDKEEENNLIGNWIILSDENIAAEHSKIKNNNQVPVHENDNAITSAVESISKPEEGLSNVETSDSKNTKMTSILKSSVVTYSKSKPTQQPITEQENEDDSQQVVCFDGGHDYTSVVEVKEEIIDEEMEDSLTLTPKEIQSKLLKTLESKQDNSAELIEQIVPAEEVSVIVAPDTAKLSVLKTPPKITYGRVKSVNTLNSGVLLNKVKPQKRLNTSLTKSDDIVKMIKVEVKSDDSEEEEDEQDVPLEDDPQPGADGMYRCRTCKRAFARERQFKAHMNVHIMYGEHYLESPSGNRLSTPGDTKGTSSSRKKQKL